MTKKHKYLMIITIILTAIHLVLCLFSARLYAYFNVAGSLSTFLTTLGIFRLLFYGYLVVCGYLAIKERAKKVSALYLLFFLFNLILPHLFAI